MPDFLVPFLTHLRTYLADERIPYETRAETVDEIIAAIRDVAGVWGFGEHEDDGR